MSWSSDRLNEVLNNLRDRGGDSTLIEVKRASGGVPSLAETLCAFGNMPDGGTIILGVDETMGFTVTGVSDVAELEAGIAAQARTSVRPPVQVDFDVVNTEDKFILIAMVAPLPLVDKPCRAHGKAFLRQADGDYAMSEQEVAQLVAMQDRPRYDAIAVAGSSVADLDADLGRDFLLEIRSSSRRLADRTDSDILKLRGVTSDTNLTVAGLYALGSYPQRFAPSLSITAATGPGGRQRMTDLAHLDGPIPDLLEDCIAWVARNLRTGVAYLPDGHAIDQPEIPLVAVRELVANALVHRDLSPRTQSKRVEVRLFQDRLVITSPGGLWGVSKESLGAPGGKSAVNEFLYDICRSLKTSSGHRVIEGEGGGIREAIEALDDRGLPRPTFINTGVSFTAIIYRSEPGDRQTRHLDQIQAPGDAPVTPAATIIQALATGPQPISSLMQQYDLSRRRVKYALDDLVKRGRVVVDGGRGNRFTTYRLV